MDETTKGKWYVGNICPLPTIRVNGKRIATISKDFPIEQREANARLIASAPQLLEALLEAKKTIRLWHGFAESQPTEAKAWNYYSASPEMKKINAAIELATGKPCEG